MQYSDEALRSQMAQRNTPGMEEALRNGRVAVAGLGGLGSNIAVMLARIGVGHLLLVDFDTVEPSNLNRQHYNITHLGMPKADALKSQLDLINPYSEIKTLCTKITEANAGDIFQDYEIVVEAFDSALNKANIVNALLECGGKKIIAASGMNGYKSSNSIITRRVLKNLYITGDNEPAPQEGIGFMAPRVNICAGHQANMVVRLLMGNEDV